jgi:hypothetical protein
MLFEQKKMHIMLSNGSILNKHVLYTFYRICTICKSLVLEVF